MMNSRERIELFLCNIKENTVIEASRIYTFLADDMTEAAFYKTLERFCQSGSLVHLDITMILTVLNQTAVRKMIYF